MRHEDQTHHASTLRDYLQVVRRRKWIIFQVVVLVPLAAVAFSLHQQKRYQASAQVLLSRQNLASSLTGTADPTAAVQPDRVAQTQADVARVPEIAARVLRRLKISDRTAAELLGSSSVQTRQNADLLDFTVTDADPLLARRLVDAYAREFTIYRRGLDTGALRRARASVQKRIRELADAKGQRSPLYASLVDRDEQLATMEALQTSNAYVVEEAPIPVQVQPRPIRNGLLGLVLGIVLGLGLGFLWEALDTRVRTGEEIGERLGGLPLLARLSEPKRKLRSKHRLAMLADPAGAQAESFRMFRTNLDFALLEREVRTIMVTSCVEQEGKTTTVANLAIALARSGKRVVLVDLDLRQPFVDKFFDADGPGVTEVALGHADLEEALASIPLTYERACRPELENGNGNGAVALRSAGRLEVLPAGPIPPDPGEFITSHALQDILARLRDRADVVLVDTPPVLRVGDAMALSPRIDGLILVTRMNLIRRPMLNELSRLLARTPAAKLGFVLTAANEESGEGYGYGYGYGYGSGQAARLDAPQLEVVS